MSTQEHENQIVLELSPEMIDLDNSINVRPFTTSHDPSDKDLEEIQRLVASIEANGQEQPVIVRPNPLINGEASDLPPFILVAGNRRCKAIMTINAGRDEDKQIPIRAISSLSVDPLKAAFDENDKRAAMSAMDKAFNFSSVRLTNGWTGKNGTKKVAEYFGVSAATVIQHDKLLTLPENLQVQVHLGLLSNEAAFIAAKAKTPEAQQKIVETAQSIKQLEDSVALTTVEATDGKGKVTSKKAKTATVAKTKTRQAKGGKKAVTAAQVKKAARQHGVESSRSKKEILEWFDGEIGPAWNEPVQDYFKAVIKYAEGKIGDTALKNAFVLALEKGGQVVSVAKPSTARKAKPKK